MTQQDDLARPVHGSRRTGAKGLTTTLMTAVIIGVTGCMLLVPLSYVQSAAGLASGRLVAATLGLWMLPCIFPLVFLRRPGTTLLACLAMGVVSAVSTPFGPSAIAALLFEGLLLELPFLVSGYTKWTRARFIIAALLLGVFMGYFTAQSIGVADITIGLLIGNVVIADASCLVFLWLSTLLARALRRTDLGGRVAGSGAAPARAPIRQDPPRSTTGTTDRRMT